MASGSTAVLNADAPEFAQLATASTGHGHRLITLRPAERRSAAGRAAARGRGPAPRHRGLRPPRRACSFRSPAPSRPTICWPPSASSSPAARRWTRRARLVPRLAGVHGRIERVAPASQRRADLCRLLAQARGAGGGADGAAPPCHAAGWSSSSAAAAIAIAGKRPLMGEIADAARRSHHRHRRQSAQRGSGRDPPRGPGRRPGAREIGDRRAAIRRAVADLGAGDLLVDRRQGP